MNELALFAGNGGGLLASKLLGWRTVCAVEINEHCRNAIMQRQVDGHLEPFPIWNDVTTFDGRPWAGRVDIVSAEPGIQRVGNGVADGVERLKAVGNGQVPAVAKEAWEQLTNGT